MIETQYAVRLVKSSREAVVDGLSLLQAVTTADPAGVPLAAAGQKEEELEDEQHRLSTEGTESVEVEGRVRVGALREDDHP